MEQLEWIFRLAIIGLFTLIIGGGVLLGLGLNAILEAVFL